MSEFLLENGAHIELRDVSAFVHACKEGNYDVAGLLIARGAELDFQDINGTSALFHAIKLSPFYYIAELDKGAQVDLQDAKGMSALMHACKNGQYYIASLLTQKGAQLDLQDISGMSALMYACIGGYYEIASLLADEGARLDLQDNRGKSVFTGARYNRHFSVVADKRSLKRGIS